jgi:hypothetical protein
MRKDYPKSGSKFINNIFRNAGIPERFLNEKIKVSSRMMQNEDFFFKGTDINIIYSIIKKSMLNNFWVSNVKVYEYYELTNDDVYNGEKIIAVVRVDVNDLTSYRRTNLFNLISSAYKDNCKIILHASSDNSGEIHTFFIPIWSIIDSFTLCKKKVGK